MDKTGTLTKGKPRLTSVIPAEGFNESQLLQMVASLEKSSEHPLAAPILAAAKEKKIALQDGEGFQVHYRKRRHWPTAIEARQHRQRRSDGGPWRVF